MCSVGVIPANQLPMQELGPDQLIRIKLVVSGFLENFSSIPISKGIKCPICPPLADTHEYENTIVDVTNSNYTNILRFYTRHSLLFIHLCCSRRYTKKLK